MCCRTVFGSVCVTCFVPCCQKFAPKKQLHKNDIKVTDALARTSLENCKFVFKKIDATTESTELKSNLVKCRWCLWYQSRFPKKLSCSRLALVLLLTECLRACLEVLWKYAPRAEEPGIQISSEERQPYELRLAWFFASMVPDFWRDHCWKVSWKNLFVSVNQTPQRSNQSYLYKKKKKTSHSMRKEEQSRFWEDPGSSAAECGVYCHVLVLKTRVDSAFQSVYARRLQNFTYKPEIWVPSKTMLHQFPLSSVRRKGRNFPQL